MPVVAHATDPYLARMDLATPYDRLRDFIDRMATIGDKPEDDEDLRVRKHALAITVLGLIPASVLWALIGLLIDRPLLTAASIYFSLAMPVMLLCLSRTKAFEPIVRVLLVHRPQLCPPRLPDPGRAAGRWSEPDLGPGGPRLRGPVLRPRQQPALVRRLRRHRGRRDRLRSTGRQPAARLVEQPADLAVRLQPARAGADRAAADPLRRRPAADGTAGVAAPAAGHAAGQDRRAAGGR